MECIAAGLSSGVLAVYASIEQMLERTSRGTAGACWIIFYIVRYGKGPATIDPDQDLSGYVRALVGRYDHQIRLLKSVKYWYLLPLYAGLLIASAGQVLGHARAGKLSLWDLSGPVIFTAVFAGIWWLNEVNAIGRLRKEREEAARDDG
jgi:hypothetical protein